MRHFILVNTLHVPRESQVRVRAGARVRVRVRG